MHLVKTHDSLLIFLIFLIVPLLSTLWLRVLPHKFLKLLIYNASGIEEDLHHLFGITTYDSSDLLSSDRR